MTSDMHLIFTHSNTQAEITRVSVTARHEWLYGTKCPLLPRKQLYKIWFQCHTVQGGQRKANL